MESPENINIEQPDEYTLSIRITSELFTYCLLRVNTLEVILFKEIPLSSDTERLEAIQQIIFESDFFGLPYHQTNVVFVSNDYNLVPQYLAQQDKKELLYNFTHLQPAKQILYSPVIIQQIITAYNTDEEMYKFLFRNLHNPQFHHHTNIIMQYLEKKNKSQAKTARMYLNFHDDFVDIFCYNDLSQIQHVLTFENENERSMVYHILNIWDKSGFDQHLTPLYILNGYGVPNMYITNKLREYIQNIESISVSKEVNLKGNNELDIPLPLDLLILNVE